MLFVIIFPYYLLSIIQTVLFMTPLNDGIKIWQGNILLNHGICSFVILIGRFIK